MRRPCSLRSPAEPPASSPPGQAGVPADGDQCVALKPPAAPHASSTITVLTALQLPRRRLSTSSPSPRSAFRGGSGRLLLSSDLRVAHERLGDAWIARRRDPVLIALPRLRWSRRLRGRDCRRPPNCVLPTAAADDRRPPIRGVAPLNGRSGLAGVASETWTGSGPITSENAERCVAAGPGPQLRRSRRG
jgi:hypothetical protein